MRKIDQVLPLFLLVVILFGCSKQEATFSDISRDIEAPGKTSEETSKAIPEEMPEETMAPGPTETGEGTAKSSEPRIRSFKMVLDPKSAPKKNGTHPTAVRTMASPPRPRPMMMLDPGGREMSESEPSGTKVTPPVLIPPRPQTFSRTEVASSPETTLQADTSATAAATATPATSSKEADKGYDVVQVFYGTDRQVTTGITSHPLGRIPWSLFAMGTGIVTLLSIMIWLILVRNKKAFVVSLILLFVTGGLVAASVMIPSQTKPDDARTDIAYNNERGEFELGTCEVSIPKTHELGELESPSIFRFEITEDSTKHVVLLGIDRLEEGPFLQELREKIEKSEGQEAFIFIHGYNVTFENAARRTAQLAYDLDFKGAPIFFSWPSQGGLLKYMVDENNVDWAVPDLKEFLKLIAEQSGAKRVHLVAHSMGNRALTRALEKISYSDAKDGPIFNEVILTAPDIDAEIFRRDLAPRIVKTAQRVTLYASSNDEALIASKKIHGYPRAGESGAAVVVVPGIDTIDVSSLDTSLLGHSYYGSNDTVLIDMAQLMLESKPPTLRTKLRSITLNGLNYWVFFVENLRAGIEDRTDTP